MSANKRPGAAGSKPVKVADLFGADSDEDEQEEPAPNAKRQRGAEPTAAAPPAPLDPEVQSVADKLALYVAQNGRSFEDLTRQRNPGATPFSFLHDKYSRAYKYYDAQVREHEAALGKAPAPAAAAAPSAAYQQQRPGTSAPAAPASAPAAQRRNRWDAAPPAAPAATHPASNSRFSEAPAAPAAPAAAAATASTSGAPSSAPRPGESSADAMARMNAYMASLAKSKEAAAAAGDDDADDDDEARRRRAKPLLNETAFDRRRVTAVYKNDGSRATHMGDYIPPEELAKFMAKSGDPTAQQATQQMAQQTTIGADNVGHKLLQKMGWKEGKGVGASESGAVAPVAVTGAVAGGGAGASLGLGAKEHGAVEESDDPFEVYRKRMMLGYKFRPNPLGNPRRDYWSGSK